MLKKLFFKFVRWIGYDLGISPNQITLGRLLFFIPGWLTWVYMHELAAWSGVPWQVLGLLAMLIVTIVVVFDIVDGALARETGQVSDEGKVLDPLADKLITYSCLALFWPAINKPGFFILLALDLTSTFLRGSQIQGANQFGKTKAFAQNISKLFFATAIISATPLLNWVGNFLIWLAVIMAGISVGIRILPARVQNSIQVAIPQILTLCNLGGGIATIWYASQGEIGRAVTCNFAAMLFDLIDGAAARKLGVSSKFGKHFDTAADLISFGLAPAVLVVVISGKTPISLALGIFYFCSTICRLWDYGRSKESTPPGFFRGLPSPAAAWLVVVSVLFPQPWLALIVLVLAAVLMCFFRLNWIHFNQALPTMTVTEMIASLGVGVLLALVSSAPATFTAGPIVVYVFSPYWRKPA